MSVRFVHRFDYVNRQIRARAQRALQEAGNRALVYCKEITPVDTGRLRASMQIIVDVQRMKVTLGSDVPYAVHVEYGTVRMAPYAMIRRTIDEFIPEFQSIVVAAMKGEL